MPPILATVITTVDIINAEYPVEDREMHALNDALKIARRLVGLTGLTYD